MQRRTVALAATIFALLPRAGTSQARQVPIGVRAEAAVDTLRSGGPLPLRITITNGLRDEIYFLAYTLTPNEWNGETLTLTVFDVERAGESGRVNVHAPSVRVPMTLAGRGMRRIPPRDSLTWVVDLAKWQAEGGWLPGEYKFLVRPNPIHVDRFLTAWVTSDTVRLHIR